jgi:tRNA1(Val) A37 N6-methylase TrmN6
MKLKIETPSQAISRKPSLLKHSPDAEKIKEFKDSLKNYVENINDNSAENVLKTFVMNFLRDAIYKKTNSINLVDNIDLAIQKGLKSNDDAVVLFEVKAPKNKKEMITVNDLNRKALQELIYYFLKERITKKNNYIKHCIITNIYEWYIFDAAYFEKIFLENLEKKYLDFATKKTTTSSTQDFYNDFASDFIKGCKEEIACVFINFKNLDADKISEKELVELYKILSPYFLLNEQAPDANRLDARFYKELLHIVGLEEKTKDGKLIIDRKSSPDRGSLLENAISNLSDCLYDIQQSPKFASFKKDDDKIFAAAFELCITWVNRILFLKLLEAQLVKYHIGDEADNFHFLNTKKIDSYKMLAVLFHDVLAKPTNARDEFYQDIFNKIPYLNSSLFDKEGIEKDLKFNIGNLEDKKTINLYSSTILEDRKKENKPMNLLEYLFGFLNAYDFSTVNVELVKQSNKPLINASVLGKVFEKINGYKDGSIYTPSFITTYMCRESLRLAVLDKFNNELSINGEKLFNKFDDIKNYTKKLYKTEEVLKANEVINSIRICDPAVGSGHFLVSALNEMIAIKYDLGILADKSGVAVNYKIELADDELLVTKNGDFFEYKIKDGKPINSDAQQMQKILFDEKRTIIEQCLFGVDININSVKICSLRLWIELLKNAYYIEEKNFTELETLPNIDINIKCGNSLVSRFELDTDLSSLAKKNNQNKNSILQYMKDVANFKNSKNRDEKSKLLQNIKDIKDNIKSFISDNSPLKKRLRETKGGISVLRNQTKLFVDTKRKKEIEKEIKDLEEYEKLLKNEIDSIENNEVFRNAFEWRFEFPEVLNDNGDFIGFDVIIGNPPYFSLSTLEKNEKDYLTSFYKTFSKGSDVYCLFYEKAFQILKPNTQLCFITSNRFCSTNYGVDLREFLSQKNILQTINFNEARVFEGIDVGSIILLLENKKSANSKLVSLNYKGKVLPLSLNGIIAKESKLLQQIYFGKAHWNFDDDNIQKLKLKIESKGVPFVKWKDISINRGVTTGLNEVFIISEEIKNEIIKQDEKSSEIIRPVLKGANIKRYFILPAKEYLIYTYTDIDIEKYSGVYNYLNKHKKELENVYEAKHGQKKWYELRKCTYYDKFFEPKLVWSRLSNQNVFSISEGGEFTVDSSSFAVSKDMKYLSAILNSKVVFFYFKLGSVIWGKDGIKWFGNYFDNIPIPEISSEKQKPLIDLVDEIIALKKVGKSTTDLEDKINEEVYKLFKLTPEEIVLVKESVK